MAIIGLVGGSRSESWPSMATVALIEYVVVFIR